MSSTMMHETKPKMTPGDFFLYLGILITLYVSVVALITFLFTAIDIGFPDPQAYYRNSKDGIAWSLSVFIVFFPILIILLGTARKSIIKNTMKMALGVRKWFIFLTLFVTGLTVAIDLIVLINYFLSGEEITTAFILKVISIILVAGGVFWFSFKDLKGVFIQKPKAFNLFRNVTTIIVIALIVLGFTLIGSPGELRKEQYDRERVEDLSSIEREIVSYFQLKEALPENLSEMDDPLRYFETPTDPKTDESYEYSIISKTVFELCADFTTSSEGGSSLPYRGEGDFFKHGAERTCFERTIDPDKFPILKNELLRP